MAEVEQPEPATRAETKEALLGKSKRRTLEAPIRRSFVQRGSQADPDPGIIADLVRAHDERSLDTLLLMLAIASGPPHHIKLHGKGGIWPIAAAVGLPRTKPGVAALAKVLARLERHHLLGRGRNDLGDRIIRLLKEDGTGKPYVHPYKSREPYFKLSFSYWLDGYDERLSFAAKTILLIGLSLPRSFILPGTQVKRWYGISPDTLERGLDGLMREELVRRRGEFKKAPLAPIGYTQQWRYQLMPPFGRRASSPKADAGASAAITRKG